MNDVTTIKVLDSTRRRLKVLAARYEVTMIELLDTLVTQEENMNNNQPRSITQSWLQQWVAANRGDVGLLETNGIKGFYRLDAGPAHSFRGIGTTWRQVAAHLEAIEVADE